jgi:hypothetical protein
MMVKLAGRILVWDAHFKTLHVWKKRLKVLVGLATEAELTMLARTEEVRKETDKTLDGNL